MSGNVNRAATSPDAVRAFLKQGALEPQWSADYIAKALGVDKNQARQIASELALMGYADPVKGAKDTWRNTDAGNIIAGARPPRLTRKTAEKLLDGLAERADAINASEEGKLNIARLLAFGPITTKHERLQDVDIGVEFEPKAGVHLERIENEKEQERIMRELRNRSAGVKPHVMAEWMERMPHRVVFPPKQPKSPKDV